MTLGIGNEFPAYALTVALGSGTRAQGRAVRIEGHREPEGCRLGRRRGDVVSVLSV